MKFFHRSKILPIIIGIVAFLSFAWFIELSPENPKISYTAGIAILMAIWWITEAIPIPATALVPVVLFPIMGVVDGKTISSLYFNHLIFLFIGGFMMALAMEKWNLHRRIALKILLLFGVSPSKILLGFMLATAILSMWMSNTATTMLMVSIGISIIQKFKTINPDSKSKFPVILLLGIAYSSSIGGIATLVGTPPNLSFARIFAILFPEMPEISFAQWMAFAFPLSMIVLLLAFLILRFFLRLSPMGVSINKESLRTEYRQLGPASFEEKTVFYLLISMAILWIMRLDIPLGFTTVPGWSNLFPTPGFINDGTIAIFIALLLFLIPSKNNEQKLLDWETANKLPWGIVLLFGGGFALAQGFVDSGLSLWVGNLLSHVGNLPGYVLILGIILIMTTLTELTSNTATTEMVLPVLAGLAVSIDMPPLLIMIPATLAASFAFMLPVATPPNAIVFGTGEIKMKDMVRIGIWMNLISAIITSTFCYFAIEWVFPST